MGFEILIGAIGAVFILGAWVFETYEGVRKHKALIDLRFAAVYAMGNISLLAYALLMGDPVFQIINGSILAVVVFEMIYTVTRIKRRVR